MLNRDGKASLLSKSLFINYSKTIEMEEKE